MSRFKPTADVADLIVRYAQMTGGRVVDLSAHPKSAVLDFSRDFKPIYMHSFDTVQAAGGKGSKRAYHVDQWLASPEKMVLSGIGYEPRGYDPDKPARVFADPDSRESYYNDFWMPAHDTDGGSAKAFLRHVAYLCNDDPTETGYVLDWLAHHVQFPGQRPRFALLMVARETGTGRGFLGEVMKKLLGTHNVKPFRASQFAGTFDDPYMNCLLSVVEEIKEDSKERFHLTETMKDLITRQTAMLNGKYGRYSLGAVFSGFLLQSNHPDALVLNDNDRRVLVIETRAKPRGDDYYNDLYGRLTDPAFVTAVWRALRKRDLAGFTGMLRAPLTAAKTNMIELNRSSAEQLVELFLGQCPSKFFTAKQVHEFGLARHAFHEEGIGTNQIGAVLRTKARLATERGDDGRHKVVWFEGSVERAWQRPGVYRKGRQSVREGLTQTKEWLDEMRPKIPVRNPPK